MKMISLLPPPSSWVPRYNKTLLGDKLGKFPAPLLMNTVHFALQAALSKIILLFQAKGIDTAVDMSWKDYFMRGEHLLTNWPSHFFSVRYKLLHPNVHASFFIFLIPICSRPNCSGNSVGHQPEQRVSGVHHGHIRYHGLLLFTK
jgi:hypothetical protein